MTQPLLTRMWRPLGLALISLALLATAIACDNDGTAEEGERLQPLTFIAGFRPQANLPFVAVYMADALGYFEEEGLDVTIRHATQGEHLQLLLAGEADVTTATGAQVLRRRAEGLPVRAFALFGQRGDQGYVVRADSGIEAPANFAGRSVGFKSGVVPAELKALLAGAGLTEEDIDLREVGFDPRVFIEGAVDVYPVFLNNEPDTIRRAGLPITVFDPADYGVPTLGLTFLTRDDLLAGDPDQMQRFLRASLRGAEYARTHLDEAVQVVLTYAEGADPEHQRFLLETDLAAAERDDGVGRSDLAQWEALAALLLEFGIVEAPIDATQAFDSTLIDPLYDSEGRLRES